MRILFSVTPAYGHLLPIVPLTDAARRSGRAVAVLTGETMADAITEELPRVEHLAAGPAPEVFSSDAAQRTGKDVMRPTPEMIGEIFGASRVDLGYQQAEAQATRWRPDLIVAEAFDAVGPLLASVLDISWLRLGIGPAAPDVITEAIDASAAFRYAERGVHARRPSAYLDPCPAVLQTPDWTPPASVWPVRPQAHRRPDATWSAPSFAEPARPTVLVTLGTIFSTPELLSAIVRSVASCEVNVVATHGLAIQLPQSQDGNSAARHAALFQAPNVAYVPFVPLDELLAVCSVLVGVGGSGTVIAALSHGRPMVLWPQGADQPIIAERAQATGASITVTAAAEIAPAVINALGQTRQATAGKVRRQIDAMPTADQVFADISPTVADQGHQTRRAPTAQGVTS